MQEIKQGDIIWANLSPTKGHEQSGTRPVLVIQNNELNKHLNTVLIIPITKNLKAKGFITTYFLEKKEYKLQHDSLALIYQIRCIDKSRIGKKISSIERENYLDVKQKLFLILSS